MKAAFKGVFISRTCFRDVCLYFRILGENPVFSWRVSNVCSIRDFAVPGTLETTQMNVLILASRSLT